jgi:hypothetical protein
MRDTLPLEERGHRSKAGLDAHYTSPRMLDSMLRPPAGAC